MDAERLDQVQGPLPVAAGLAAVAGFLDAHLFQRVADVFVANMSGNVVLLGIGIGDVSGAKVGPPAVALAAFSVGMGAATWVHDRRLSADRRLRPDLVVLGEVVLILGLALFLGVLDVKVDGRLDPLGYLAIAGGAVAMGAQTAVIRRVGAVAVSTTYESGAVVRLSEDLVLAATEPGADARARRRQVLRVVSAVVIAYCAGSAVAAAIGSTAWALAVPLGVLVVCAAVLHLQVRRVPPRRVGGRS